MGLVQQILHLFSQCRLQRQENEEFELLLSTDVNSWPRVTWFRMFLFRLKRFSGIRRLDIYAGRAVPFKRCLLSLVSLPLLLLLALSLSGIPPSFEDIWDYERHFPQHDVAMANTGGVKYLRISNPSQGRGLNNILEESIITSYIAFFSNRSFVFEDYIWSNLPLYTIYDYGLRPSRMPLNAFISGPTAGGPMPGFSPRAVSSQFWDSICPPEGIRVLNITNAPDREADGMTIVRWWKEELDKIPGPCVTTEVPFLNKVIESGLEYMAPLWPSLSASPILQDFNWSPLVESALLRNFMLFQSPSALSEYEPNAELTIGGLVAVHLRRGDFEEHCPNLAKNDFPYLGFNSFPGILDRFEPPSGEEKIRYYMEHCYPTIDQIVSRLREIRSKVPGLRKVYVLTNARPWWLANLLQQLQRDGWDDLKSTLDLKLDSQQYWVSNAVDMAIAEKAQVFLGNGFSSLTANVFMFRIAKGLDMSTNRLL